MTGETIAFGICAGVAATLTMDVLANISQRVGLTAGAKGQWVGRWYLGILRGQFTHSNIAAAPEQMGEKWAALVGHYLIGIALSVFYLAGTSCLGIPAASLFDIGTGDPDQAARGDTADDHGHRRRALGSRAAIPARRTAARRCRPAGPFCSLKGRTGARDFSLERVTTMVTISAPS